MLHRSLYYPPGHWSLWNVSDFSPRVVNTLETWFYLHSLPVPLFLFPPQSAFPIQPNSTRGLLNLSLPNWFFFFFGCNRLQWRNMWGPDLSFRTVFQLFNVSFVSKPKAKGKHSIQFNLSQQLKHGYDWLQEPGLKKFKLETYFILNGTTIQHISPSTESNSSALKGCSIGYLWVTGLRNSVWGIMTVENHFAGLGIGGRG